jgi:SAM-dependent methyltransferase
MGEWFENESFWKTMYEYLFPESRLRSAPEEVKKIISLTDFKGSSVLDLCCGPGRHSIAMANEGFKVTGVDLSPFLLKKAKDASKAENINVEWIREDMRKFERKNALDLVLNLFTSFGYYEDDKDNEAVLSLIYQNLKEKGILVIDTMSKEILARIYQPTSSTELENGSIIVLRAKISDDWHRCHNQWLVIKDGKADSYSWSHTLYSGKELETLLYKTGFKKVKLYGNLDGDAYNYNASRLIAIAYK